MKLLDHKLIEELHQCNHRIGMYLSEEDWKKAGFEVESRHELLAKLSRVLKHLDENSSEGVLAFRRKVRWALEDLQSVNEQYIEQLQEQVSSSKKKIREVRKGRTALRLYKKPADREPRFLNRVG